MADGATTTGDTTARRADSKSYNMRAPSDTFDSLQTLDEYLRNVIVEPTIWQSLAIAIATIFQDMLRARDAIPYGVILAAEPLLGLAGAGAFGTPAVHVPISSRRDPLPTFDTLASLLAQESRLSTWLRKLPPDMADLTGTGPLLVRAWEAEQARLATDFGTTSKHPNGILCLARAPDASALADLPVLLDVSRREADILAAAIHILATEYGALPGMPQAQTLEGATDLLDGVMSELRVPLSWVLQSLNTPDHDGFKRLEHRVRTGRIPETSALFEKWVLAPEEDAPRHAACLFVVSHFGRIAPGQFIELGDVLVASTPATVPAADQSRPPDQITDRVLQECRIRFTVSRRGEVVSTLSLDDPGLLHLAISHDEALNAEMNMRDSFDREAPLLKERYLTELALRLTLGHASDAIAEKYRAIELTSLSAAAAMEPLALFERLRRIVFGYPTLLRAKAGFLAENQAWLEAALFRSIKRAPGLIDGVAARVDGLSKADLVKDLTSTRPVDNNRDWEPLFDSAAALLFWSLYANDAARVTLRGLPCFFVAAGTARRERSIAILFDIFDGNETALDLRELQNRFDAPPLIAQLLRHVAADFADLFHEEDKPFRVELLIAVALEYVKRAIRGVAWRDVSAWEEPGEGIAVAAWDLTLAKALLAPETELWFARLGRTEPRAEAPRGDDEIVAAARRCWLIARIVIDGLVGSATFGESDEDIETLALDIGLLGFLDLPAAAAGSVAFDRIELWLQYGAGRLDEEKDAIAVAFEALVRDLHRMLIVLILMAATRHESADGRAGVSFSFSAPLQEWLTEGSGETPAKRIAGMVDQALKRQAQFRGSNAHGAFRFDVPNAAAIRNAYNDRLAALRAFADAIRPLARVSRKRATSIAPAPSPTPATNLGSATAQKTEG